MKEAGLCHCSKSNKLVIVVWPGDLARFSTRSEVAAEADVTTIDCLKTGYKHTANKTRDN